MKFLKEFLEAVITIVVLGLLYGVYKWTEKQKKEKTLRTQGEEKYSRASEEKEVEEWFSNSLRKWEKEYLEYLINGKIIELSLYERDFEDFLKKKGLELRVVPPLINMADLSFYLIDKGKERIVSFLKEKNYPVRHPDNPEKDLEEYLRKIAESKVEEIISEYLKQRES